jgi:hypothetical protein
MTKSLQYVKVFEALQTAKGPMTVSQVKAIDGIVPTRLSTYLWEIKKNTGFAVRANRDGRAVVSYELVGNGTAPVAKAPVAKVTKPVVTKTPVAKAPKAKAKAVSKPVLEQDSIEDAMSKMAKRKPIDVLDEIDTTIEDFEDREYAKGYVSGAM